MSITYSIRGTKRGPGKGAALFLAGAVTQCLTSGRALPDVSSSASPRWLLCKMCRDLWRKGAKRRSAGLVIQGVSGDELRGSGWKQRRGWREGQDVVSGGNGEQDMVIHCFLAPGSWGSPVPWPQHRFGAGQRQGFALQGSVKPKLAASGCHGDQSDKWVQTVCLWLPGTTTASCAGDELPAGGTQPGDGIWGPCCPPPALGVSPGMCRSP